VADPTIAINTTTISRFATKSRRAILQRWIICTFPRIFHVGYLRHDQYERNGELGHGVPNDGYHTAGRVEPRECARSVYQIIHKETTSWLLNEESRSTP
jgi:hypothetical protein